MAEAAYNKKVQVEISSGVWATVPQNDASLNIGRTMLDDTIMDDPTARSRIYGLLDWSLDCQILWDADSTVMEFIKDALMAGTAITVRYLPDGNIASPGLGFEGQCLIESLNYAGNIDGEEVVSATFQADGPLSDPA